MVNPGKEVLDDLCMRFVLNCPEEELRSWERLLFQVEQAHWFYEDHVRPENTQLRSFSLKDFVIVEELFRSATGAVYKARRKSDRKLLVLKERRVAELGRRAPANHEAELLRRVLGSPWLQGARREASAEFSSQRRCRDAEVGHRV